MDSIIKKILSNPQLLNIISENKKICGIVMGGSRMLNLESSDSDYDLNIIMNDQDAKEINSKYEDIDVPNAYFVIDGFTVHWHYMSASQLVGFAKYHRIFWQIESYYGWQKNDNYLLINDKEVVEQTYNTIKKRFKKHLILLKEQYNNLILNIINNNTIQYHVYKDLYHLCIISCLVNNITLNKQLLLKLKKYCAQNSSKMYMEKHSYDLVVEQQVLELINKLYVYLQKIE